MRPTKYNIYFHLNSITNNKKYQFGKKIMFVKD